MSKDQDQEQKRDSVVRCARGTAVDHYFQSPEGAVMVGRHEVESTGDASDSWIANCGARAGAALGDLVSFTTNHDDAAVRDATAMGIVRLVGDLARLEDPDVDRLLAKCGVEFEPREPRTLAPSTVEYVLHSTDGFVRCRYGLRNLGGCLAELEGQGGALPRDHRPGDALVAAFRSLVAQGSDDIARIMSRWGVSYQEPEGDGYKAQTQSKPVACIAEGRVAKSDEVILFRPDPLTVIGRVPEHEQECFGTASHDASDGSPVLVMARTRLSPRGEHL